MLPMHQPDKERK